MQCAGKYSLFSSASKKLAVSTICHHSAPYCKKFQFRNMLKLSQWKEFSSKESHFLNIFPFHLTSCCKSKGSGSRMRIKYQLMLITLDFTLNLLGCKIWPFLFLCPTFLDPSKLPCLRHFTVVKECALSDKLGPQKPPPVLRCTSFSSIHPNKVRPILGKIPK